jgi:hypothetical protein
MRLLLARFLAGGVAPALVLVAGCTQNVAGLPTRSDAQPLTPVRAGDMDLLLVTPGELRKITGRKLQLDADQSRPIPGSSTVPACSGLDAAGMAVFVGDQTSGFHVLLLTDGDQHSQVLAESVAVYLDSGSAAAQFGQASEAAKMCDGQRALTAGGDAAWKFTVNEGDPDTVRWTKEQIGIPITWNCHAEARLRNNVIVQAMACAGDDSGAGIVTTIADRMSAAVWELSGR